MTKSDPCRGQQDALPSWCSITTQEETMWPPILTINPASQSYSTGGRFCNNLVERMEPADDDDNDETMIMAQALFQTTRAMLRNTNRNQQRRRRHKEQAQVSDATRRNPDKEPMLFLPPVGTDSLDLFLEKQEVELQEESRPQPPTAKKPRDASDNSPENDACSVSSYDSLKYHHRRLDEGGHVSKSQTGRHR